MLKTLLILNKYINIYLYINKYITNKVLNKCSPIYYELFFLHMMKRSKLAIQVE